MPIIASQIILTGNQRKVMRSYLKTALKALIPHQQPRHLNASVQHRKKTSLSFTRLQISGVFIILSYRCTLLWCFLFTLKSACKSRYLWVQLSVATVKVLFIFPPNYSFSNWILLPAYFNCAIEVFCATTFYISRWLLFLPICVCSYGS